MISDRLDFEKVLIDLKINKKDHNVDLLRQIFESTQDFQFKNPEERGGNLLLTAAAMLSLNAKVCFLSPSDHSAKEAEKASGSKFPVEVPGHGLVQESVARSQVVFMHGADYTEYLPKGWSGRKIIQFFPNDKER